MHVTPAMRAAGRLAALAAVGVALAATSMSPRPCDFPVPAQQVTFDVVSDCGPAGSLTVAQDGTGHHCPEGFRVEATGAEAMGLPSSGRLEDPARAGDYDTEENRTWLARGFFVLAGPVSLPGTSPEITVDRVCRFDRLEAGALEMVCLGPAPEARCSGTLTPAPTP